MFVRPDEGRWERGVKDGKRAGREGPAEDRTLDSPYTAIANEVYDRLGPRVGLAALGYYGWLRRHVNRDPQHPLYGYAWPSRRYSSAHFHCHHSKLAQLEEALAAAGLLVVERASALVERGEVSREEMCRVLHNPSASLIYRVYSPAESDRATDGDRSQRRRRRVERRAAAAVAASAELAAKEAARVEAAPAPRVGAAAAAQIDLPEKAKPEKDRPDRLSFARRDVAGTNEPIRPDERGVDKEGSESFPPEELSRCAQGMSAWAAWSFLREGMPNDYLSRSQLESLRPLGFAETELRLGAVGSFNRDFVIERFGKVLNRRAQELGLSGVKVVFEPRRRPEDE